MCSYILDLSAHEYLICVLPISIIYFGKLEMDFWLKKIELSGYLRLQ
jgi:hypothetical protein